MPPLLSADFQPTQEHHDVYDEGWKLGRAGLIKIPEKYADRTDLSDLYYQGFYDAHAGRDKAINQNRTYPED